MREEEHVRVVADGEEAEAAVERMVPLRCIEEKWGPRTSVFTFQLGNHVRAGTWLWLGGLSLGLASHCGGRGRQFPESGT